MLRHITLARIFGLLLMVAAAGSAYWLLTDDVFTAGPPEVTGDLRYTDPASTLAALGPELSGVNVFRLRTSELRGELMAMPGIANAQVSIGLPNHFTISLTERIPAFALSEADGTVVLVDAEGRSLAAVDQSVPAALGLPTIQDQRGTPPEQTQPGATIDPIDLAAIVQLGAVTPALIDSSAASLVLAITPDNAFVMTAQPQNWEAIFGFYTPNLRPTDMIPRQVQCLRSLLGAQESSVTTVYLAPLDQNCGTYVPDATPPAPTTAPAKPR